MLNAFRNLHSPEKKTDFFTSRRALGGAALAAPMTSCLIFGTFNMDKFP